MVFILAQISQGSALAKSTATENVELNKRQQKIIQSLKKSQDKVALTATAKNIRLTVTKLKDNQGNVYIGAIINRAELAPYLTRLSEILGDDFAPYRALQAARDHQQFHITLISPPEYQGVDKALVSQLLSPQANSVNNRHLSNQFSVTLLGLGKVEKDHKQTFFVVAQSNEGQFIRQQFLLPAKDFHVTLAFNPSDIYGVSKDNSTLIKP